MTRLDELKSSWEKMFFFDEQKFNIGLEVARQTTSNWNDQSDPAKVFIKGRRVHHGAVGVALIFPGILFQHSYTLGYAYGLMEDDIDDTDDWFTFEKGGDPNSIFSFE